MIRYYLNLIYIENISENYQNALKYLNDLINNGEFLIESNELYRRYGSKHERGYINFWITIDNIPYRTFEHRIIYYLYFGVWDDTLIIHHRDNNKSNNKIQNLELTTQFENILYSIRNNEIAIHPSMLDDITKNKYHLDGEKWEIFKLKLLKHMKGMEKKSIFIVNNINQAIFCSYLIAEILFEGI